MSELKTDSKSHKATFKIDDQKVTIDLIQKTLMDAGQPMQGEVEYLE